MKDEPELELKNQELLEQVLAQSQQINQQIQRLNDHKMLVAYNSIPRLMWFHLLKGIALGLGSVLGATVVLSAFVYVLSQIEFIPVIGDMVSKIIEVVQAPD